MNSIPLTDEHREAVKKAVVEHERSLGSSDPGVVDFNAEVLGDNCSFRYDRSQKRIEVEVNSLTEGLDRWPGSTFMVFEWPEIRAAIGPIHELQAEEYLQSKYQSGFVEIMFRGETYRLRLAEEAKLK